MVTPAVSESQCAHCGFWAPGGLPAVAEEYRRTCQGLAGLVQLVVGLEADRKPGDMSGWEPKISAAANAIVSQAGAAARTALTAQLAQACGVCTAVLMRRVCGCDDVLPGEHGLRMGLVTHPLTRCELFQPDPARTSRHPAATVQ